MTRSIGEILAVPGAPMALDAGFAAALLALDWPQAAQGDAMAAQGEAERYRIERGVAVVPVRGILTPNSAVLERWFGWSTYRGIEESCAALALDEGAAAVVLEFDTPGGMVLGIEDAAQAVAALAAIKPVYALAAPLAASAGYWLASQAREISMTPGASVGSIGVAVTAWRAMQPGGDGSQEFEFTSPHARAKWPDPTSETGRAEIIRGLAETEARFHAAVAAGRKIALADLPAALSVSEDPADGGAVFAAPEAQARGLADRIETRAAFYARVLTAHAPAPRRTTRAALARARAAEATARS